MCEDEFPSPRIFNIPPFDLLALTVKSKHGRCQLLWHNILHECLVFGQLMIEF